MPRRHSIDQVDEFKKTINSIVKIESNSKSSYIELKTPITDRYAKEIRRWIENEQVLCCLDSDYFESRYAFVCDEEGQILKFESRLSQRIYTQVLADYDEKQFPIQLLILKGRQLGITTQTALKFIHRMMFVPHTQAIMASVKASASELIQRILDTAYNNSPWWLVPGRMPKGAFANGSILSIQSGMQATGIAQGWTPTMAHLCLEESTYIHLQDGNVKCIKDVSEGDKVVTSRGRQASVKCLAKSYREDEVACEISLWGNYSPLVVTRDHPILTPSGFEPAENLSKHDYVCMPVRPITHTLKTSNIEVTKFGTKKNVKRNVHSVKLSQKWGWMCGLYLAEGSAHRNLKLKGEGWDRIHFCIHEEEIGDFKNGLQEAFGLFQNICVSTKKGTRSSILTVNNSSIAKWLVENFGHLADGKRLPDWVFTAGKDFVHGILKGYFEGDGHIPTNLPTITGCSISLPLLLQVRSLLASCGFGWSALYHEHAGVRYGRNCRERWQLCINGEYARKFRREMGFVAVQRKEYAQQNKSFGDHPKHWKYSLDGKFIYIEVFENRAVDGAKFYDLEVDAPEHDFCTIHCCVKNSELADIPNPKRTIEEGLFRAMHPSKNLFMVLEGTGGGSTGWLADTWRAAKEGNHRLKGIFIPWGCCPEIYPKKDFIREHGIPENFMASRSDACRKHVARAESYIRNTSYLSRVMGKEYRMPIEQQWFWEFNYRMACQNHTQKTWLAQMPCVTGDTRISSELGVIKIEDAQNVSKCESGSVAAWLPRGEKLIFELHTKEGRILRGTKDHLVRNWDGNWKALGDFVPGESITLLPPMFAEREYVHRWNDTPLYGSERIIDEKMGRLLGYFMGDGSFTGNEFNVACDAKDTDTIEDVSRLIEHFTGKFPCHQIVGGMVRVRSSNIYWKPFLRSIGALRRVIHQDGHFDGYTRDVKVLECIFRSPRNVVREFLRGVFECDAHGYKHTPRIDLSSAYSQFLRDIQLLLLGFNIKAKLMKIERKDGSKIRGAKRGEYFLHHLAITCAFANRFYDEIGFISTRKMGSSKRYKQEKRRASFKHLDTSLVDSVREVIDTCRYEPVFDLSIDDVHHFSANGIDVHNCDDFESLTGKHDTVFEPEVIDEIENNVYEVITNYETGAVKKERKMPVATYAITGHDVDEIFYPEESAIDFDKPMIRVSHQSHRGQSYHWDMIPLLATDEELEANTMDRLIVYEPPMAGQYYSTGVDTADGMGKEDEDRTVLSGTKNRYNDQCDEQIFELTSNRINSAQIVAFAACVGAWYGPMCPDHRGMRYCVEQIGRPGDTCQHQLKMMGFNNMHKPRRYDGKAIREKPGNKEGWYSNSWSVPMLMARFIEAVNGGWYIPRSKWLIEELKTLERHEGAGKSKMEHRSGSHDDRVRSAAQSYFTRHDDDVLAERAQKRYSGAVDQQRKKKQKNGGRVGLVSVGAGWD